MVIQLIKQRAQDGDIGFMIKKDGSSIEWYGENREEEAQARYRTIVDNFKKEFEPVIIAEFNSTDEIQGSGKYTKGMWRVDATEDNVIRIVSPWSSEVKAEESSTFGDYRGAHICEMHYNNGVPTKATALANAKLIAAAPGLKDALVKCADELIYIARFNTELKKSNEFSVILNNAQLVVSAIY